MRNLFSAALCRQALAWRGIAAASVSIALAACTAWAGDTQRPPETTLGRIDALIGAASCDADSQCRVAGVGHRSCGGPATFRAWSIRDTPAESLDAALQAHADEQRRAQQESGRVSTCNVLPVPAVSCVPATSGSGHCVLLTAATR